MADRSTANRRFTDGSGSQGTVIGEGIRIQGELTGSAPVQVIGRVEGALRSDGLLEVRPEGSIKGDVRAADVVVEGRVEGTVSARTKVELRTSCRVHGDIEAQVVAMADGALFEGRVRMGAKTPSGGPEKVSFREKRSSKP